MTPNIPSIFEGAVAEAVIQHAPISDFPRIRTWRSIDAEGRWSPAEDRVSPVVYITATTPEPDPQGQRMVTVLVGAVTNAADDQEHARLCEIESALQDVLDKLETHYSEGHVRHTFDDKISDMMAGSSFTLHIGGIEHGTASEPVIDEGFLAIEMQVVIHYSRSDR